MARGIPVAGPMGGDEKFGDLFMRFFNIEGGCLLSQDNVKDQLLLSRLDVTEINRVATELAGKTIYGDAILFYNKERFE